MKYLRLFSFIFIVFASVSTISQNLNATEGGCVICPLNSDNKGRCVGNNGIDTCVDERGLFTPKCKFGAKSLEDCTQNPE